MGRLMKSLFRPATERAASDPARLADARREAETIKDRGNAQLQRGELAAAAESYRAAIQLAPDYAEAYNNLGNVLRLQERLVEAEGMLQQAIALKPELGPAHFNLGLVAADLGKHAAAAAAFRTALEKMPDHTMARLGLADALNAGGRHAEAISEFTRVLEREPRNVGARIGIGVAQRYAGNTPAAIASLEAALAIEDAAMAWRYLGMIHHEDRRWHQALACYRKAHAGEPANFQSAWNLALLLLLLGDYAEGFALFEQRLVASGELRDSMADAREHYRQLGGAARAWQGDAMPGKTCLVWTEQGLGDTLMLLRYLPLLRERSGARLVVQCEEPLARLVAELPDVERVVAKTALVHTLAYDVHCPMMSLPYRCDSRLETLPATVPYLRVPEALQTYWRERLGGPGRCAGLVWSGNKSSDRHASRSLVLDDLTALADIAGVRWVSLQKGAAAAEANGQTWLETQSIAACTDLLDTAALVTQLDLVVTIDTSVAHLAGALGKPVWLLHRMEGEWRWLLERTDSPWYPSMRIFRQTAERDWAVVLSELTAALREWAGGV
jgi:tetratricopeptide (TPR) repeat protein